MKTVLLGIQGFWSVYLSSGGGTNINLSKLGKISLEWFSLRPLSCKSFLKRLPSAETRSAGYSRHCGMELSRHVFQVWRFIKKNAHSLWITWFHDHQCPLKN